MKRPFRRFKCSPRSRTNSRSSLSGWPRCLPRRWPRPRKRRTRTGAVAPVRTSSKRSGSTKRRGSASRSSEPRPDLSDHKGNGSSTDRSPRNAKSPRPKAAARPPVAKKQNGHTFLRSRAAASTGGAGGPTVGAPYDRCCEGRSSRLPPLAPMHCTRAKIMILHMALRPHRAPHSMLIFAAAAVAGSAAAIALAAHIRRPRSAHAPRTLPERIPVNFFAGRPRTLPVRPL
mmetsp:Transcript_31470/g.82565  ORF Transcript_31470/g.82565 Transcript_31470/m.82565 type:complete len:230 (-) Transcript_31470:1542-2231(-)